MHAHLCIHSHIHMHSCACAYVHICIHAHMHTNTHEYTLIHAHYVCIHTCMHGHTNANIHRYTCTHTHTQPVLTPILLAQCTSGSILIFTGHTASLLLAQKPTPLLHAQLRKCREVVFSRLWLVFSNSSNNWTDEICYDYLCVSLFTKVSAPQEAGWPGVNNVMLFCADSTQHALLNVLVSASHHLKNLLLLRRFI